MKLNRIATFIVCLMLAFTAACGGPENAADSAGETTNASRGSTDSRTPVEIATTFMEAGNAADQDTFLSLLTPAARTGLGGDDESFSMTGDQFASFEIGEAVIDGAEAKVPIAATQDGQPQDLTLNLRHTEAGWRVWGMDMTSGEMSMSMNFETFAQVMQQTAEGMAEAMKESFESSMGEWQAGGSEAEIAAERGIYEALLPISEEDYPRLWMNANPFPDATISEALRELAARLGLGVDAFGHEEALNAPLNVEITGISNLEAIERVCAQAGLYPTYPDLEGGAGALGEAFASALAEGFGQLLTGEDSPLKVTGLPEEAPEAVREMTAGEKAAEPMIVLHQGPRDYPIAFAGPFMVEVVAVEETPPHGTGSLSAQVFTFGINPGLLKLIAEDGEATQFTRVADAMDRSLIEDDIRYLSGGQIVGGAYYDIFHMDLRHLLRDVTTIETIEGVQRVRLPLNVQEVVLENPQSGETQTAGPYTLEIKNIGENTRIDVTGAESAIQNLKILMAADNAQGEPLGIAYQDSMAWMPTKHQATLNTPEAPARIRMKLITTSEPIEYAFALGPVPLTRFAEMPEKLEALAFGGHEAPLSIEFVAFKKDDPNFPEIELRIRNHSNKDATVLFADLIYADAKGEKLDNMPTTITGEFGMVGHEPVAAAGQDTLHTAMAFAMPDGTATVTIEPIDVEFVDGTKWQAER